jgi:hypothetical protein
MTHAAGTLAATLAAALILCLPSLCRRLRGRLAARKARRAHPWCCECAGRRQDARSRHPAGTGMGEESRVMWAEMDAFEAAAETFRAEQDETS